MGDDASSKPSFFRPAYVCNRQVPLAGSKALAEWFTGTGRDNTVDLKSEAAA